MEGEISEGVFKVILGRMKQKHTECVITDNVPEEVKTQVTSQNDASSTERIERLVGVNQV